MLGRNLNKMATMEIDKICRACLRKDDKMINMNEKEIYQKFLLFANVTGGEEIPHISLNLCRSCEQKLKISLNFKEDCQKSHEILLNYVKNNRNDDLEAQIPLNCIRKNCVVDLKAQTLLYDITEQYDIKEQVNSEAQLLATMKIDEICRACLRKGDKMIDLTEKEIYQKFLLFANVTAKEEIPLVSLYLCRSCEQKLRISLNFKEDCQKSHVILLNYIKNTRNVDLEAQISLNDNKEEQIVFNDVKETYEVDSEATAAVDANIRKPKSDSKPFRCSIFKTGFNKHYLIVHLNYHKEVKVYKCGLCNKLFSQMHWLKMHLKMHESKGGADNQLAALKLKKKERVHTWKASHKCTHCEKKFQSPSKLVVHERTHTGERPYVCQVCGKGFTQTSGLKKHMVAHNVEPKINCNICSMKFSTVHKLRIHFRNHIGEKPFVCAQCGKGFMERYRLARHNRTHSILRLYQCYNCDKSFEQKSLLITHMLTHSGEKRFVCTQCGMGFIERTQLDRHFKSSSNFCRATLELKKKTRKTRKCTYCEKKFKLHSDLMRHKSMHTGERPCICQVCGKGFAQKSILKKHMVVHNLGTNIFCNICKKKFSTQNSLRTHLRSHTGEKPFVCTQCGKGFAERRRLTAHIRTHSDSRPYQCNNCQRSFRRKPLLTAHMLIHSGEKPYKCNQCAYACRNSSSLTMHVMKKHEFDKPRSDRPHSCLMCNRTFTTNAMLMYHVNRHNVDFLKI